MFKEINIGNASKKQVCQKIYTEAFGSDVKFDSILFERYFNYCLFTEIDNEMAAMLFLLPCEIEIGKERYSAKYLYAAATAEKFKNRGIMTRLLDKACKDSKDIIFLKPADASLFEFYKKRGFLKFSATTDFKASKRVVLGEAMDELSLLCEQETSPFNIMAYNNCRYDLSGIYFVDTLS